MSDDCIATKELAVIVQENGIIRRADTGYLIGRLVDDYKYENLPNTVDSKEKPVVGHPEELKITELTEVKHALQDRVY